MIKVAPIRIQEIAKNAKPKKYSAHNIVRKFADSNSYLSVIALEAFVEFGRTFHAYKRGGFDEARERLTEEMSGALFWLGGIPAFNLLFSWIGKKMLNMPNGKENKFELESDNVRKPVKNFIDKLEKSGIKKKNGKPLTAESIAKFKIAQALAGVVVVNAFIGFIVPKINQAITRARHNKNKNIEQGAPKINQQDNTTLNENISNKASSSLDMQAFDKKTDKKNNLNSEASPSMQGNNVAFEGLPTDKLLNLANFCETNRNFKLLSIDAGTVAGRTYSARNNDERAEIAIRDITSIWFYSFNMMFMNKWLNMIEQRDKISSKGTRIDSDSARFTADYLTEIINTNKDLPINELEKELFGNSNAKAPKEILDKLKNGVMNLDEFNNAVKSMPNAEELKSTAKAMSELQPQIKGVSILTEGQINDIFKGGALNDPEYLKHLYSSALGDKVFSPFKFVRQKDINTAKADAEYFVQGILKKAKQQNYKQLTKELINKAEKSNLKFNALNVGLGFATSALFLSTIIPKMQYAFTKWRTGSDTFPGTKDLD